MGVTVHHAIIVTGGKDDIDIAHKKARQLFDHVSNLVPSPMNCHVSFFVAPDGSLEGWKESNIGDENRKKLIAYFDEKDLALNYVEICYGGDFERPTILYGDEIYGLLY
jgi:hypothetical protein